MYTLEQQSESEDLELEKLQLAKEQPTQLKEGIDNIIVTNVIMLLSLNYHSHYMLLLFLYRSF